MGDMDTAQRRGGIGCSRPGAMRLPTFEHGQGLFDRVAPRRPLLPARRALVQHGQAAVACALGVSLHAACTALAEHLHVECKRVLRWRWTGAPNGLALCDAVEALEGQRLQGAVQKLAHSGVDAGFPTRKRGRLCSLTAGSHLV